jgi:hypothetical protein
MTDRVQPGVLISKAISTHVVLLQHAGAIHGSREVKMRVVTPGEPKRYDL